MDSRAEPTRILRLIGFQARRNCRCLRRAVPNVHFLISPTLSALSYRSIPRPLRLQRRGRFTIMRVPTARRAPSRAGRCRPSTSPRQRGANCCRSLPSGRPPTTCRRLPSWTRFRSPFRSPRPGRDALGIHRARPRRLPPTQTGGSGQRLNAGSVDREIKSGSVDGPPVLAGQTRKSRP